VKATVRLAGAWVGNVWLQTAGSKVHSFGQWAAATFAAPRIVIASQCATSNCKLLLVRISL